jgi:hypothetical protein
MSVTDIWSILGIEATGDERAIKRAYAKRLKIISPEADPAGYMQLREAYEVAKQYASFAQLEQQDAGEPEIADARADELERPEAPRSEPESESSSVALQLEGSNKPWPDCTSG